METLIQRFLSLDHHLMPETVLQIHLFEEWILLFFILIALAFTFRKYLHFSSRWITRIIFCLILGNAVLLRLVSFDRGFETMVPFDSFHYTIAASELAKTGDLTLPINQENHPIGKAPGFSLLLAPVYILFQNHLGAAILCPLLLGILSLFLLYHLSKRMTDPPTALLALLLMAFSPLHITYSKMLFPSMSALFFTLTATLLLTTEKRHLKNLFLSGLCFGFAATIRYLTIASIPAAFCYLLLQRNTNASERLKNMAAVSLGLLLPIAGLLFYQWLVFGTPWQTGYDYWEHFLPIIQKRFSWEYAFGIPPSDGVSPNVPFALLHATGAYIPGTDILTSRPDQILLAIVIWLFALAGFVSIYKKNRPFFWFILIFFLGSWLPHIFYVSQTGRYMLPNVPFILLVSAAGMTRLLRKVSSSVQGRAKKILLLGLLGFIPFATSFSHYPFEKGNQEFLTMTRETIPFPAYLVTDFDAMLFTHLVGRPRQITVIALSDDVLYAERSRYLRGEKLPPALWGAAQHLDRLKTLLQKDSAVYCVLFFKEKNRVAYKKILDTFDSEEVARSEHYQLLRLKL
ncbi:MAG: glycosyltransferase family 39 protein [Deltaproteobacteria bacterium]|nr:glycosyltransferase family 39 protein [Deltaproteobacteria bacterium]